MNKYIIICLTLLLALPQLCVAANPIPQSAQTTAVAMQNPNNGMLTMMQALEKVQAAGYSSIYEAEFDDGRYKVKALDSKGHKVKLYVNPVTGAINVDRD
ncbi:MAG: PepSY domain-containing protein [Gammaproteobacteria bacterium]|nr:PepSY domain-containing protein [Gammaproteobacteria bacterium]